MKARTRVLDFRGTMGQPAGQVEMPTLAIPERCHQLCSWVVVKAATRESGSVSRLKRQSAMCGERLHREFPQEGSRD